jgi:RHS repeat-associated protein
MMPSRVLGIKLQKQIFEATLSTTNTHDYIGGIEYQDNTLEAIYTDEGRAKPYGTTYRYEYTIKDHLGNSRVMFSDINNDGLVDENEIIQEDHYYPFGLKHEGYGRNVTQGENFYQFNGKELNQDFGLDMYDYGARWYDASVGRWFAIDPLAEKYVGFSPFNYVVGNPIMFIDLDGRYVDYGDNDKAKALVERAKKEDENFAATWKILEESDVTYSFNFLGEQNYMDEGKNGSSKPGSFSSDGEKVYINFHQITYAPSDGEFTSLIHETEHAMQFEHGELGFKKTNLKDEDGKNIWQPILYDIMDEVKAFEAGMSAPGASTDRLERYKGKDDEGKMEYVSKKSDQYKSMYKKAQERIKVGLPAEESNLSSQKELIKNGSVFMKPYKERKNE